MYAEANSAAISGIPSIGDVRDMDTQSVVSVLLSVDALLLKAAGATDESVFRNAERRLFDAMVQKWTKRAKAALKSALTGLDNEEPATKTDVKRIMRRLNDLVDWGDGLEPVVTAVVKESYQTAKLQIWRKAQGIIDRRLVADSPHLTKAKGDKVPLEVKPSFTLEDERAIKQLSQRQMFWIGNHYNDNLRERVGAVTQDVMLQRGLGRRQAGQLLREALENEFGLAAGGLERGAGIELPKGWHGTTTQYFEGLAANTATVARVQGAMRGLQDVGATHYVINNPVDERSCERCKFMDGKSIKVSTTIERVNQELEAKHPDDVKDIHPWANSVKDLKRADANGTLERDYGYPPFHFRCRCTVDISEEAELIFEPGTTAPELEPALENADVVGLREGKVISRELLGGGINKTELIAIEHLGDTRLGVWKPRSGEKAARYSIKKGTYYKREAAAYDVAEQLGVGDMLPPTVTRKIGKAEGAAQLFVEGKEAAWDAVVDRSAAERMRVFDWVVGNTDRHGGNWLLFEREGGKVMPTLIDHGLCFPVKAPDRFIQPMMSIQSHTGTLLKSTRELIAKIDPEELASTLHKAGIEREAIQGTLRRLMTLKDHPEMIEIPKGVSFKMDDYFWDEIARDMSKKQSSKIEREISGIMERVVE